MQIKATSTDDDGREAQALEGRTYLEVELGAVLLEDVEQREQVVGVRVRVHQEPPRSSCRTSGRYCKEQRGHRHGHRRP